jgi:glutathione-regulated potassium-efflux system ancillary protein KefC
LLIIAIDDREKILNIVHLAHKHFPHLKLLVRAIDRRHAYELIREGVDVIQRETFSSSLEMGIEALKLLGFRAYKAQRAARTFREHDEQAVQEMAMFEGDEQGLLARSRQMTRDLEQLLQADNRDLVDELDHAWDVSALRKEV